MVSPLFAFAGIWEGDACALLTTKANDLVRPAHDRMPVILDPRNYAGWLDPSITDPALFTDWLRPYPADAMETFMVWDFVNDSRHEGPACAEPLTLA
jgi:putative SOS response-associated peptidase YedK